MEALRLVLLFFFISHIPATLLMDLQAVVPPALVPAPLRSLRLWYVSATGDPLMREPFAPWFAALIYVEALVQLPFFFVAAYALYARRNWIRLPALAYGVSTATTLVPIFGELLASPLPSPRARAVLVSIYAPYFVLPLVCAAWMASSPEPFQAAGRARKGKAA